MDEQTEPHRQMISPSLATQAGFLPIRSGPIRFAVGPPDGITSNAWRIWATKHGDVYIACRDNFNETKVSLHASGRWRMGFTTEAIAKKPEIIQNNQNRAWDVWDMPPTSLPNTVIAFRLFFPISELAVRPDQRKPKDWAKVIFIEALPEGKLTVISLFITLEDIALQHESEPSFCLASLNIGNNKYAQVIAHGEPEGTIPAMLEQSVADARKQAASKGIAIPKEAYGYFLGQQVDGCRFLVGARINRSSV